MRRSPLYIAAAGAVVIVLASALLALIGPPDRPGPGPLGSDSASSEAQASGSEASESSGGSDLLPAGQRSPVPVLLVHGYAGGPSQMKPLADQLTRAGRRVVVVPLPGRGTGDIRLSAFAVALAARDLRVPLVDVVGFSLGGVAARQWLLLDDPTVRIRHLVMLATPNAGVALPNDSGRPEQERCEPTNACGQLRPGSPLLRELADSRLAAGRPAWLTVASESDKLVRPPAGVALPGARNLVLQKVCPGAQVDHGAMDDDRPILGLVTLFLDGRLPAAPTCDEVSDAVLR